MALTNPVTSPLQGGPHLYATLVDLTGTATVGTTSAATGASTPQTTTGNTADLSTANFHELAIDVNVTAVSGTTPSLTLSWQRKGTDGIYYTIWTSSAITTAGSTSTSIGPGTANNQSLGATGRLVWTITGTTPSFTFSYSIQGK